MSMDSSLDRPIRRRSLLQVLAFAGTSLAIGCLPGAAYADSSPIWGDADVPWVSASSCLVMDSDGNVLFSRNADVPTAMASTTKIMTATVALESGLPLDTVYTVSANAASLYGQVLGLWEGQTITLNDLLHGALIYSGNDAAVSIAECVGGSEAAFVDMMNAKAVELGLTNTHYMNPHGLDADGHYTTCSDLLTLVRHITLNPVFNSIVGQHTALVQMGDQVIGYDTTDELHNVYPGIMGVKTGYTANAGRAFVGKCVRGGVTIYWVVIGCAENEDRWLDSRNILDWAYSHYAEQEVFSAGSEVPLYFDDPDRFGLVRTGSASSDLGLRSDLTPGEVPTLDVVLDECYEAADGLLAVVTMGDERGFLSTSAVVSQGLPIEKHEFGPILSPMFYQ